MCLPAFALIPAMVSAAAGGGALAAGTTGTFLGLSGATLGTISAGAGLVGTGVSAISQIQQGQQQAEIAKTNAELAQQRALDAKRRGSREEGEHRTKVQRFMGSQRAAMGRSGVVGDEGSGGDVLAETAEMGERDAQRIRVNAEREAWGYGAEADIYKYQGRQATTAGYYRAGSTLLGGVTDVFRPAPWWRRAWGAKEPPDAYDRYG